jgi:hypothetical protein
MDTKNILIVRKTKFTGKSSIINVDVINKETNQILHNKECKTLEQLHNLYDKVMDMYNIPYEQLINQMITE